MLRTIVIVGSFVCLLSGLKLFRRSFCLKIGKCEWRKGWECVSGRGLLCIQNLIKRPTIFYIRRVAGLARGSGYENYWFWAALYGTKSETVESCIGLCWILTPPKDGRNGAGVDGPWAVRPFYTLLMFGIRISWVSWSHCDSEAGRILVGIPDGCWEIFVNETDALTAIIDRWCAVWDSPSKWMPSTVMRECTMYTALLTSKSYGKPHSYVEGRYPAAIVERW